MVKNIWRPELSLGSPNLQTQKIEVIIIFAQIIIASLYQILFDQLSSAILYAMLSSETTHRLMANQKLPPPH